MKLRTKHRGFTLIELLIVVAIIAILAAIAVPNFLEAQTRSKIARVKADMRSCATAIEEYAVDFNRAPIGYNEGQFLTPPLWDKYTREIAWSKLTTPIAYITTIPIDPFAIYGIRKKSGEKVNERFVQYNYNYTLNSQVSNSNVNFLAAAKLGYIWALVSPGPTMTKSAPTAWGMFGYLITQISGNEPLNVYDSTNGTTSGGYIIRSNKGYYTGNND